jgi:hypothetical protein
MLEPSMNLQAVVAQATSYAIVQAPARLSSHLNRSGDSVFSVHDYLSPRSHIYP